MLDWQNGLPFSAQFSDVYFSTDSGMEETRHVFLQGNRLAERFAALRAGESFAIGETGFGTGLNFLCAWQLFEQVAPQGASLDFFSVEKFPLQREELRAALALWPALRERAAHLLARWHRRVPGWNRWHFAAGRVRLTLALCDVAEALPEMRAAVDAWFLDGFSPARNPEMWTEEVFAALALASRPGASFATYSAAGRVRRGLLGAGFEVEKTPGYGRKREMLRGQLPGIPGARRTPASALVVGAGLAGCAAAHALAGRGIAVTLVDAAPALASGASGNPRGILHARLGAGMNALHRLVLASYGHALALLDEVLPVDGVNRAECGLLQLAIPGAEAARIAKLALLPWPEHLLRAVEPEAASVLAGMPVACAGLWFPGGGWVAPPQLCARLAAHPLIAQRLGYGVTELECSAAGWRAYAGEQVFEAECVVVCCGHRARAFSQFSHLPLTAVRGQISELPATEASRALGTVLCAEGYCSPALAGRHVAGATHGFNDEAVDVRVADHAANLDKLALHMPALRQALGEIDAAQLTGRAGLRCSAPGAMPLAGEVERGLYCSLAHGTRGLLTAGLAAETIAAALCGQTPPLPASLLSRLKAPLAPSG